MRRLIPAAIFGTAALTISGCAHGDKSVKAQEPRVSWSCPLGTYPDASQDMPNCRSRTPMAQGTTELSPEQRAQGDREQNALEQAAREQGAKEQAIKDHEQLAQQLAQAKAGGMKGEGATGAQAGATGAKEEPLAEKRVPFDNASANLNSDSKATLDEFASTIQEQGPEEISVVRIEGYADNTGDSEQNKALSEQRADAVKSYLEEKGVPTEKLETESFGDSKPVASNDNATGRALNRTAVIVALK